MVRTFAVTSAACLDIYMSYGGGPTVLYDTAAVYILSLHPLGDCPKMLKLKLINNWQTKTDTKNAAKLKLKNYWKTKNKSKQKSHCLKLQYRVIQSKFCGYNDYMQRQVRHNIRNN